MHRSVRRLGATTVLALVAGLAAVSPASAAAECGVDGYPTKSDEANAVPVAVDDTASVVAGRSVDVDVLANDTDADEGDTLAVVGTTATARGEACVLENGRVRFTTAPSRTGYTQTFQYAVSDGAGFAHATVTVTVKGLKGLTAKVQQKLLLKKNGRVKRAAKVTFANPNATTVRLFAGGEDSFVERVVSPGKTIVLSTRERELEFLSYLQGKSEDDITLVNAGTVNTRTGKVRSEYIGARLDEFSRSTPASASARALARQLR